VSAAAISKMEFAYGSPLQLKAEGALYRFTLTPHVYRHIVDPQLADVRVFNGEGALVPHSIRRPQAEGEGRELSHILPFFPLYEENNARSGDLAMHFTSNASGVVLDLRERPPVPTENKIQGYLIDLSQLARRPTVLETRFYASEGNFVCPVRIEQSDDLTRWDSLVTSTTLAALAYDGYRLERRRIKLPAFKRRYLRLLRAGLPAAPPISAIVGLVSSERPQPPRQVTRISGRRVSESPAIYEFDTGGFFPVDRIDLHLEGTNQLVRAKFASRATATAQWRPRFSGLFYNLRLSDVVLQNDPHLLPLVTDPHWRMELLSESLPAKGTGPALELGWMAHDGYFVAGGEPPFLFAYGNAAINAATEPVGELLSVIGSKKKLHFIQNAVLEETVELGGERRLSPSLTQRVPWRQWALWAALCLSVCLLSWMAWRLARQIRGSGADAGH
jgi:hypothetical protein